VNLFHHFFHLALVATATAFQPVVRPPAVTRALMVRTEPLQCAPSRTEPPQMVLPKIVGAVLFLPWFATVIINNLPTEQRLKIQKSALLQSGATMRVVNKNEKPKVRGARLPPDAVAITEKFKKVYPRKDLELLWGAMLKCYGSQANAILAARSNPQILNPSYSFCNTMLESKRVLLGVLTEEEALEVMLQNPSVLQCGPSLEALGASEIKSFAGLRGVANSVPEPARVAVLGGLLAAVLFPVVGTQVPELADSGLLAANKAFVGAVLAPIFAVVILYLSRAGGA